MVGTVLGQAIQKGQWACQRWSLRLVKSLSCVPTLCGPMDCSPPGSSVHGFFPGKNTGVGCHFLLQGIFPTQGSNMGLPQRRQTLYRLSHQGTPLRLRAPQVLASTYPKVCSEPVDPVPSRGHRAQAGKSGLVLSDKTRSPFPRSQVLAAGRDHLTGGSIRPAAP